MGTSEKEHNKDNKDNHHHNTDWIKVSIICGAAIGLLAVINLGLIQLVEPNKYSLTFNGDLTYYDGSITLVVNNNDKNPIKKILIYGSNNNTELKVSSSHLVDESHLAINSANITFDGKSEILLKELKHEPKVIDVSIDNISPGEYTGRIIFTGNDTTTVPIKVTTEPLVVSALLWVLIGILISVISWEVINHLTVRYYDDSETRLTRKINKTEVTQSNKQQLEDNKKMLEVVKSNKHKQQVKHNYRWSGSGWPRQAIYIIGSAGFAMSVGVISLLTNDYVTGQRTIEPVEIMVLIGIGLGIGSLKEFVDKPV